MREKDFSLLMTCYFSAFGFAAGDKRGSGQASFVGPDRDSGMDTDEGRGVGVIASLGRGVGGKRRRMSIRNNGPNESPIMPDPVLPRRRLDFE